MMRREKTINFDEMKKCINEVDESLKEQYAPIKEVLVDNAELNEDEWKKVINNLTFAPSSVFAKDENDKRLYAHADFLELTGFDILLCAAGTANVMSSVVNNHDIEDIDRALILLHMGKSIERAQISFGEIIHEKYRALRNEILYGVWYQTADYLKYITNDKVLLSNIDAHELTTYSNNVQLLYEHMYLYNKMDARSTDIDNLLFTRLIEIICGTISPCLFSNIFSIINNLIIETVYNNELIKMKFTPDEVNMIQHMVSEQLGHYMHDVWENAMIELYKLAEYMHTYAPRTSSEFDKLRCNSSYPGLIDSDFSVYE